MKNATTPNEGTFSNAQELRFFAESLLKSMKEGHIKVSCDPGYPFEPVRLLHMADRIERDEKKIEKTIEDVAGLPSQSLAFEVFIYAESLFCNLLENDWYEGGYPNEDVKAYDDAELHLRIVLDWIRKKDPTFSFEWYTSDIVVNRFIGSQYKKLDNDSLNAARALCKWMPEEDRAAKSKEWWDSKIRETIEDDIVQQNSCSSPTDGLLTIEEAIRHAEEVSQRKCDACGRQHQQLANWLRELVETRSRLAIAEKALQEPNDDNSSAE